MRADNHRLNECLKSPHLHMEMEAMRTCHVTQLSLTSLAWHFVVL